MEKTYWFCMLTTVAVLMVGCNTVTMDDELKLVESDEDCLVSIVPCGEITTEESAMSTKASQTDDLYAVQVYKYTGSTDYDYNGYEPFAFGIFDNLESMKVYLKKDSKFKISVAMVKDAKKLLSDYMYVAMNALLFYEGKKEVFALYYLPNSDHLSQQYGYIFIQDKLESYNGVYRSWNGAYFSSEARTESEIYNFSSYYRQLNVYTYSFTHSISVYESNLVTSLSTIEKWCYFTNKWIDDYPENFRLPNINKGFFRGQSYPQCSDWFYGEIVDFHPTGQYESVDLNFCRTGFRLKYELSGASDGEVTVTVKNDTRTFISNTTSTATYSSDEKFFAFADTWSAWKYADNYTENVDVSVVWKRGIGVTQDLGTKTIQIKRNCLNNIRITLGNDDRNGVMGVSVEDEGAYTDQTDVEVK